MCVSHLVEKTEELSSLDCRRMTPVLHAMLLCAGHAYPPFFPLVFMGHVIPISNSMVREEGEMVVVCVNLEHPHHPQPSPRQCSLPTGQRHVPVLFISWQDIPLPTIPPLPSPYLPFSLLLPPSLLPSHMMCVWCACGTGLVLCTLYKLFDSGVCCLAFWENSLQ